MGGVVHGMGSNKYSESLSSYSLLLLTNNFYYLVVTESLFARITIMNRNHESILKLYLV